MIREFATVLLALALPAPPPPPTRTWSGCRSRWRRLQSQISASCASPRKAGGDPPLNEGLAEQNDFMAAGWRTGGCPGRGPADRAREMTDRLSELGERVQALQPLAPRRRRGSAPPPRRGRRRAGPARCPRPAAPRRPPPPRELYSQAYADYARGNYDLAIQGYREYLRNYPEHRPRGQRAVLDRRVPVLQEAVRGGHRGLGRAVPRVPRERQAARRALQEGHGPRAAGPAAARP